MLLLFPHFFTIQRLIFGGLDLSASKTPIPALRALAILINVETGGLCEHFLSSKRPLLLSLRSWPIAQEIFIGSGGVS